jgi:hypothetical protein
MKYILEYKAQYIVSEPLTKNRTCQSSRWKQYAMSDSKEVFEEFIAKQKIPGDWRIEERPTEESV